MIFTNRCFHSIAFVRLLDGQIFDVEGAGYEKPTSSDGRRDIDDFCDDNFTPER
jgi:hypothetical protein